MAAARRPARAEPVNSQFLRLWTSIHNKKAWLFSDTVADANASAVTYSLLETAKANELEPYTWLRRVLRDLPAANTVDDVATLLPWNMKDLHTPDLTSGAPS